MVGKRRRVLQRYRDRRRARLNRQFRKSQFSDRVHALSGFLQKPNMLGIFLHNLINLILSLCVAINHYFFDLSFGNMSKSSNFSLFFVH